MTYHRIRTWSNMTGATSDTGTDTLPEHQSLVQVFSGISIDLSLVL